MGNQPTIIASFSFENVSCEEAFSSIESHILKHTDRFIVNSSDKENFQFNVIFVTPNCGWHDRIVLVLKESGNGCTFRGVSSSTNILCGWCGVFRSCTRCITCYSDNAQNIAHLRELADAVANNSKEELENKKGFSIYSKPKGNSESQRLL